MAEGFSLELQEHCSYCGDFEPEVRVIECSTVCERRFITNIKCKNADKCARIAENLRKRSK